MGAGAGFEISAAVTLRFESPALARAVAKATAVDNPKEGVSQRVEGRVLHMTARAAPARSARQTLDDWLRCAAAAAEAARRRA